MCNVCVCIMLLRAYINSPEIPVYLTTYLPTYLPSDLHTCAPKYLYSFVPAYTPT